MLWLGWSTPSRPFARATPCFPIAIILAAGALHCRTPSLLSPSSPTIFLFCGSIEWNTWIHARPPPTSCNAGRLSHERRVAIAKNGGATEL
uniref:Uncharacterized protein n=1 Tax=Aegilops tauschii subsp. strangulata TaxID=200361 RepID=A0A453F0P4_AEGTS